MFAKTLAFVSAASLLPSALAAVYCTAPVATTSWAAGAPVSITWLDNDIAPRAADFGPSKISIYVGNAKQQTPLQLISDSVDVSTTQEIVFTPDASIGPSGGDYFIRFESLGLKDPADPKYPALAFSSKFALTAMTGSFNTSVQAQIDGASTAPIAAATGSASGSPSNTASRSASMTGSSTQSSTASRSGGSAAPTSSAPADSGAMTNALSFAAVVGAVIAVAGTVF
jgi:hypothetical protein